MLLLKANLLMFMLKLLSEIIGNFREGFGDAGFGVRDFIPNLSSQTVDAT